MEALLYSSDNGKINCRLCSHFCTIKEGQKGICGVRENKDGVLKTLVYGKIITTQVDPIEKKPLYHFYPGSTSYSIATVGCNFRCSFCQNYSIAQMVRESNYIAGEYISSVDLVNDAIRRGCASISYTYTEPTVYFEQALEVSKFASQKGIKNVFVTNGYMSEAALDMIEPYLDAANVDLKSFNDDFYRKYCGAKLEPVLKTLVSMKRKGIHLEVTTLVIPGLNDSIDELDSMADFIKKDLGADTPWHISRFHPTYKLTDTVATKPGYLVEYRKRAEKRGLKYVYTGNIVDSEGSETRCCECGASLIKRDGYRISSEYLKKGICSCGAEIDCILPLERENGA